MCVLIWTALLFYVRGISCDRAALKPSCHPDSWLWSYCISLSEGETTAEAGLCAVIPCSFTAAAEFKVTQLMWYKCGSESSKCDTPDRLVFNSSSESAVFQSEFRGRMSLLESDLSLKNCSIIINDLRESDSGSYQLRLGGYRNNNPDGFTFISTATLSVTGLSQTPTVTVPPLTAGQQNTLTCTAPGLCSGSAPTFTWRWRKPAGTHSHITGNITAVNTENVSAVAQRHSSTLTFNLSAEHHGTEVTCKVSFTGGVETEETVTLNVSYVQEIRISGNTTMEEGETLNLTCTVDSFPPSFPTWTKLSDRDPNTTETQQHVDGGVAALSITNVRAEHSGRYICTATHLDHTWRREANVTVTYMREPEISGKTTVKEGDALNLTCDVESFPPSYVTWTKSGSDSLREESQTGSVSVIIYNTTADTSGQYVCTAQHPVRNVTAHSEVTVTSPPKIFNISRCMNQQETLSCVCISRGFPPPSITWPLLKNHSEYSVSSNVSKHTVNSTVTLHASAHSTTVECVSTNEDGETREFLQVRTDFKKEEDDIMNVLLNSKWLQVAFGFIIGTLFSAAVVCLARRCHRKKSKNSGNQLGTMEMQTVPETDAGHNDETQCREVNYSVIDFSMLKRKNPTKAKETPERTEYTEIKTRAVGRRHSEGKEGETLEGNEEQQVAVVEQRKKEQCIVGKEEEYEEVALYSNVHETKQQA